MNSVDVLIIGGSAAGIVSAVTGKANYQDKSFMVIRREPQAVVPCGIPYIYGSLECVDQNVIPTAGLENAGVELRIDTVSSIDTEKKMCRTESGEEISFEKLIIATGSVPFVPSFLKGADQDNVYTIPKDKEYLEGFYNKLENYNEIIVVGGGFIGVEISDELNKKGQKVTLIEILPNLLGLAFDKELAVAAEGILKERGVKIRTGSAVQELLTDGVLLAGGEKLSSDAVILSMGYTPNTTLASQAGLRMTSQGFIAVDEYMRTDNPDIFAVGDCAEKRDFITRKQIPLMLASTACAEARVAGMNLYSLSSVKRFSGTIAVFSTAIGDTGFGAAGMTQKAAESEGFEIVTGEFKGIDRHPGKLPGTHEQFVKLIASRESGTVLGGEVIGGTSTGELINLIGFIIQSRMNIYSILTAQIGTHPLLTAAPTAYPLIKAAEAAARKI